MEDKIVVVKGREYRISFPNVGQYYDIEALKQSLGKGFYNMMLGNRSVAAQNAIDIEATITVMMPDLVKDMKVKSFRDLGLADYTEIREIYDKEIIPFLLETKRILSRPIE